MATVLPVALTVCIGSYNTYSSLASSLSGEYGNKIENSLQPIGMKLATELLSEYPTPNKTIFAIRANSSDAEADTCYHTYRPIIPIGHNGEQK